MRNYSKLIEETLRLVKEGHDVETAAGFVCFRHRLGYLDRQYLATEARNLITKKKEAEKEEDKDLPWYMKGSMA